MGDTLLFTLCVIWGGDRIGVRLGAHKPRFKPPAVHRGPFQGGNSYPQPSFLLYLVLFTLLYITMLFVLCLLSPLSCSSVCPSECMFVSLSVCLSLGFVFALSSACLCYVPPVGRGDRNIPTAPMQSGKTPPKWSPQWDGGMKEFAHCPTV